MFVRCLMLSLCQCQLSNFEFGSFTIAVATFECHFSIDYVDIINNGRFLEGSWNVLGKFSEDSRNVLCCEVNS